MQLLFQEVLVPGGGGKGRASSSEELETSRERRLQSMSLHNSNEMRKADTFVSFRGGEFAKDATGTCWSLGMRCGT